MANCHDAANIGVKPTAKSCGATGACHTGTVHPARRRHTTLASTACTVATPARAT